MSDLRAGEHDAVGGLVRVLDVGGVVEEFEHLLARGGFYSVGCEEDVAGYFVG